VTIPVDKGVDNPAPPFTRARSWLLTKDKELTTEQQQV
jgi:hypothetical protein